MLLTTGQRSGVELSFSEKDQQQQQNSVTSPYEEKQTVPQPTPVSSVAYVDASLSSPNQTNNSENASSITVTTKVLSSNNNNNNDVPLAASSLAAYSTTTTTTTTATTATTTTATSGTGATRTQLPQRVFKKQQWVPRSVAVGSDSSTNSSNNILTNGTPQ
jgi:hypothetical protein